MLQELRIRGLGVIADAVLEFGPGLTVVTGETGAGKTMVVTGLALLFGGRADPARLRPGVDSASVEGQLEVPPDGPVAQLVVDAGGDIEPTHPMPDDLKQPGALILRRVVSASGRSRAVAGGASVPASLLARLAADLVVVHGQSDQIRLTQPSRQRATLDRYAGLDVTACRSAFRRWQDVEAEVERRRSQARELAREAEALRLGLADIDSAAPQPGEDVELGSLSARLEHVEELRVAAQLCHDALAGSAEAPDVGDGRDDVLALLASARRAAEHVSGTDPTLDQLAGRLTSLAADAADVAAELSHYLSQLDADPERLSSVFSRRAVLQGLTRKYGADVDDVLAWAESARRRLADTDASPEALAELERGRDEAKASYFAAARQLSERRVAVATELSERISVEIASLGMPAARVSVDLRERETPSADGIDEVEFTLRPHPDAKRLPIQKGASGGELSRVMLGVEVVLADADPVPTMVFDEVDAGVGGRAAIEIGRRLATLARDRQVIVVTHLAQVAAFADNHLVVDKRTADSVDGDAVTHSDIRAVNGPDRLSELARMLSGADTDVARLHAAELLEQARPASARR